jgi:hypothetical protein
LLEPVEVNQILIAMGTGIAGFVISAVLMAKEIYFNFFLNLD